MLEGALILAGGRSRRMGQAKEALPFAGSTLLERTVRTVVGCARRVVVVGRGGDQCLPALPGAEIVHDERPEAGPLAALATGLRALLRSGCPSSGGVFATGCDAPFLNADGIAWLTDRLGGHRVAMPRWQGVLQPLCAVYRADCLPAIDELLLRDIRTPRVLAEIVGALVFDVDELPTEAPLLQCLVNVNTPEQYERARRDAERQRPQA